MEPEDAPAVEEADPVEAPQGGGGGKGGPKGVEETEGPTELSSTISPTLEGTVLMRQGPGGEGPGGKEGKGAPGKGPGPEEETASPSELSTGASSLTDTASDTA